MGALRRFLGRLFPARWRPAGLVARRVLAASGGRVMAGPFRGLRIVVDPRVVDWPKVFGTYEKELHPVVEEVVAAPPPGVINVGAAEGYYAAGLAARCPGLWVTAFESRPEMRDHITRVAAANGVADRVRVAGECWAADLAAALADRPGSLLVVDIEGAEVGLLDPARVPGVDRCPMLIETHDDLVPGGEAALADRFRATHARRVFRVAPRTAADLPVRWPLAARWLTRMMGEGRPNPAQTWLYLVPNR